MCLMERDALVAGGSSENVLRYWAQTFSGVTGIACDLHIRSKTLDGGDTVFYTIQDLMIH